MPAASPTCACEQHQPRLALPAANTPRRRPPSEDAAYEAFDQGKYLTALQLATKAAELGDPQAHTLVGRIYAEGYGTSKNSGARRPMVRPRRRAGRSRGHVRAGRDAGRGPGRGEGSRRGRPDVRGRGDPQARARQLQPGAALPQGRGQAGEPASRLSAHAVCCRGRRGGRAIRSRHALRHRHRRRAERLRGREVDRARPPPPATPRRSSTTR